MSEKKQVLEILNRAFSWKYNSLAAYVLAAQPYVKEGLEGISEALEAAAEEDRTLFEEVAQTIESLGGVPRLAPYNHHVSELNYLSVDYLLTVVIAELEKQLSQLQLDIQELDDDSPEKEMITKVITYTSSQLDSLQALV